MTLSRRARARNLSPQILNFSLNSPTHTHTTGILVKSKHTIPSFSLEHSSPLLLPYPSKDFQQPRDNISSPFPPSSLHPEHRSINITSLSIVPYLTLDHHNHKLCNSLHSLLHDPILQDDCLAFLVLQKPHKFKFAITSQRATLDHCTKPLTKKSHRPSLGLEKTSHGLVFGP